MLDGNFPFIQVSFHVPYPCTLYSIHQIITKINGLARLILGVWLRRKSLIIIKVVKKDHFYFSLRARLNYVFSQAKTLLMRDSSTERIRCLKERRIENFDFMGLNCYGDAKSCKLRPISCGITMHNSLSLNIPRYILCNE